MFKQFTPLQRGPRGPSVDRPEFVPCGATQPLSIGFASHSNGAADIAGVELLTIERKMVPADVVKREANKRCDAIQAETGRRPKGKHLKEIREEITHELLAKAFPKRKIVPLMWLDDYLLVGSTSAPEIDAITSLLVGCEAGLVLGFVKTRDDPSVCLTKWARHPSAAGTPWAVGQDMTVLTGEGKATFKTVNVQSPEAVAALAAGTVTALALTSQRETMFTLTELLQVKRLAVGASAGNDHADAAAAECHLFRGELAALMSDLITALGGVEIPNAA